MITLLYSPSLVAYRGNHFITWGFVCVCGEGSWGWVMVKRKRQGIYLF